MIICYALAEGCGDFMSSWSRCNIYTSCTSVALPSCELVRSMSVRMYPVGAANSCVESETSRGSIFGRHTGAAVCGWWWWRK
jgi:hypothetical protein